MLQTPRPPLVLLVEDSDDDAFFFQWTLKKCGIQCELVHLADGGVAIDHLKAIQAGAQPRPDILFLDLKLPTYTGFEILGWLKEQRWPEPLRVFVLSGSEHATDITRATGLGAAGYFVKPVAAEQLRIALTATPAETTHAPSS